MTNQSNTHILEIKSTHLLTMRLVLKSTDFSEVARVFENKMAQAGDFFKGESIVIDAHGIVQPLPWDKLIALLKRYELNILGIYTNERLCPGAIEAGLNPISLSANNTSNKNTNATESSPNKTPTPSVTAKSPAPNNTGSPNTATQSHGGSGKPTMVIKRQLRSGQRIYANDSDLIVIGSVGHGAEIIADGNIHVYGSLLGRAIAGAKGDNNARIFTTHLNPELVAIAGIYRLFDADFTPEALRKTVIVELENESLTFHEIKS